LTSPCTSNQGAAEDQDSFVGGLTPHNQVLRGHGTWSTFTAVLQFINAVCGSTMISALEVCQGSKRFQTCGKPQMEKISHIFHNNKANNQESTACNPLYITAQN
jgi:hypothetical protein